MPQLAPRPLPYSDLPGLSARQLAEHYKLYLGYVNKTNEIWDLLQTVDRQSANSTYSPYRELKLEETFALNGVKLHELYFANLGGSGGPPTGEISFFIQRDFGSASSWTTDFRALGLAARGWGILALDINDRTLHNFLLDAHNVGGIQRSVPLLVLDVYEHAYLLDYGTNRAHYLDAFFYNIDWQEVNRRLRPYLRRNTPVATLNEDVLT
ncbi:MAG: superoxide dismutase [bacterium]|jgi:Fe-Mn family superoxide dismutase